MRHCFVLFGVLGPDWDMIIPSHAIVSAGATRRELRGQSNTPDGRIVLLTVFRKTRQHEQRQIDRAVRAQKTCERDHHGPAMETYERQV